MTCLVIVYPHLSIYIWRFFCTLEIYISPGIWWIFKKTENISVISGLFHEEENENMGRSISTEELESAFKLLARDKIPSNDGCPV